MPSNKKPAATKAATPAVPVEDKAATSPKVEAPVEELMKAPEPQAPVEEIKKPKDDVAQAVADATAKTIPNPGKNVVFLSRDKECNVTILAGGVAHKPIFDHSGKFLVWYVDPKQAKDFEAHTFVKFGKIFRALES